MPRVIAVTARKGGVGKSTTALQLAAGFAARGHSVLAVDADPQADLTRFSGGNHELDQGLHRVLSTGALSISLDGHLRSSGDRLSFLDSSEGMDSVNEIIRAAASRGPFLVRDLLLPAASRFDIVIFDVGHATQVIDNILLVADVLVIPTPAAWPDADHVGDTLARARRVRDEYRAGVDLDSPRSSVISLWRRHHNAGADHAVIDTLVRTYGPRVSPAVVPNSSHVGTANKMQVPLRDFFERYGGRKDRTLKAVVDAYEVLTDTVLDRLNLAIAA